MREKVLVTHAEEWPDQDGRQLHDIARVSQAFDQAHQLQGLFWITDARSGNRDRQALGLQRSCVWVEILQIARQDQEILRNPVTVGTAPCSDPRGDLAGIVGDDRVPVPLLDEIEGRPLLGTRAPPSLGKHRGKGRLMDGLLSRKVTVLLKDLVHKRCDLRQ